MLSFDQYLDSNVKFGPFHLVSFVCLSLASFMDGFQISFLVQVIPIQKKEYNLNQLATSQLISSQFGGMFVSYLIYSKFADIIGRKNLLTWGIFLVSFGLLLHSYANDINIVMLSRFLLGMTIGWLWGLPTILMIEITPSPIRGRVAAAMEMFFIAGIVYMTLLCQQFDSYDSGDWRSISSNNSIISIVILILVLLFTNESPRYYLMKDNYFQAWKIINKIQRRNGSLLIQEQQMTQVMNHSAQQHTYDKIGFRQLWQVKVTQKIWVFSILLNLLDKSVAVFQPFLFLGTNQSLSMLLITSGSEVPAGILTMILIDSISHGGRIRGLKYGFWLMFAACLSIFIFERKFVVFSFIVVRFSMRLIWAFQNPFIIEAYQTQMRSAGSGAAQMIGKLAGSFTPFLMLPLYESMGFAVFLILATIGLLTNVVLSKMSDSTCKQLDDSNPENELSYNI